MDIIWGKDIDGLVYDCSSSISNALELLQFGTEPSIYAKTIDRYQITKRQSKIMFLHLVKKLKYDHTFITYKYANTY